eukprot:448277-Amphidinium_carterae.2
MNYVAPFCLAGSLEGKGAGWADNGSHSRVIVASKSRQEMCNLVSKPALHGHFKNKSKSCTI